MILKQNLKKYINIRTETKTIGEFVFELFENHIEHEIVNPLFVTDYPKEVSPFARENKDKEGITERFELFAFGSELANGFSELIDPRDQEERLKTQALKKGRRG
jgi:lysyl-tRNA synthetase class 2